ncbi:prenyltransferase [Caldilinea sp.]|uniref:prenyltransferase n=1 Tax=Caldilinea sp. TaxID=2293560 RepID=UPI001B262255|nr:prenyltransferase [Caldilinea sp.]MBO9393504.1 prenyltransferase [Caldilinea sp.]
MTHYSGGQATESPSLLRRLQQAGERRMTETPLLAVLSALRPDITTALVLPSVLAAVIGGWWQGELIWPNFLFAIISVLLSAFAFQMLSAYQDFQQSLRAEAYPATDLPNSAFTLQQNGLLHPIMLLNVGALLYTASALCGLWLALLAGWPVLFFGALAFLLQLGAVISPVRYAYRGYGMGELGVFVAFGFLSLISAYYAQTHTLSWLPVLGGLPISLLVLLVVLSQNLTTQRRDWLIGKRTLAVILGPERALDLNVFVTMLAYVSILAVTVLTPLPLWYLAGLATSPLAMGVFSEVNRSLTAPEDAVRLRSAALKAAFWTTLLCIAALFISRPG